MLTTNSLVARMLITVSFTRPSGPQVGGKHAERRVLAEHVEETERRRVDHAGRSHRRHPRDRPRQHEGCEHLVALTGFQIVRVVLHGGHSRLGRQSGLSAVARRAKAEACPPFRTMQWIDRVGTAQARLCPTLRQFEPTACSVHAGPPPSSALHPARRRSAGGGRPGTSRRAGSTAKCRWRRASGSPGR